MTIDENYLKQELYLEIQQNPQLVDFLLTGSLDGVWYWDLERPENEWMSPEFWRSLGIDPHTKQHSSDEWQDLVYKDDLADALANLKRHCADPSHPYDQIVRYRHADGSIVWVRCRGLAIRDADGNAIRMFGAHTNVTALKSLVPQSQQQAFFSAIETAPIALVVTTSSGRLLYLNQSAYELFSLTKETADRLTITDIFEESFVTRHTESFEQQKTNSDSQTRSKPMSTLAKSSSGDYFQSEVGITLTHLADNPIAVCSVTDMTSSITLNEQLTRSNGELANFAYIASHDLQGPVRRVAGFLDLLKGDYGERLGSEACGWIDRSIVNIKRMQSLIASLLAMSQLQSQPPALKAVNITEIVYDLVESLQDELDDNGTTVWIEKTIPILNIDSLKVSELLSNLLRNGIKYGRGNERRIEIGYLESTDITDFKPDSVQRPKKKHAQPGFVTIYVKDNGVGIHSKNHEKVFEIFHRLHNYDTQPGNGIGLAICKHVVEAHGGIIWLESEECVGSTFYFNLPIAAPKGLD